VRAVQAATNNDFAADNFSSEFVCMAFWENAWQVWSERQSSCRLHVTQVSPQLWSGISERHLNLRDT